MNLEFQYKKINWAFEKANNYKENSSKQFARNIAVGIYQNMLFNSLGKFEFIKGTNMPTDLTIAPDFFYFRAMYVYLFSLFEFFLSQFLIENIKNETVTDSDGLKAYLRIICQKGPRFNISFQRLEDAKEYYKMSLNIHLEESPSFTELGFLIEPRHLNTHNFGIPDVRFKKSLWGYIPGIDKAMGTKIDEAEIDKVAIHMFNLIEYMESKVQSQ